jgi:spermidine/putrescine transport system permease protein
MTAIRRFLANPSGKPRYLAGFTWLYIIWSIAPVLIAIQFSFNDGRSRSTWQGFSTRWYWGDPNLSVWHDESLRRAMFNSLELAFLTILLAVPIGVGLAVGLTRWRSRAARPANALMLFPLVTPEIVLGSMLFIVFVNLFDFISLGRPAQVLGHVTFSISYVVIVVRARLLSIGPEYEEAAQDLGASRAQALRTVLLPMLLPAIVASVMVVFAVSIDDFVISAFLSEGAASETVPIKIYSTVRGSPTPALNALATVMLVVVMFAITIAVLALWWVRRRHPEPAGEGEGSAVKDFATLDI